MSIATQTRPFTLTVADASRKSGRRVRSFPTVAAAFDTYHDLPAAQRKSATVRKDGCLVNDRGRDCSQRGEHEWRRSVEFFAPSAEERAIVKRGLTQLELDVLEHLCTGADRWNREHRARTGVDLVQPGALLEHFEDQLPAELSRRAINRLIKLGYIKRKISRRNPRDVREGEPSEQVMVVATWRGSTARRELLRRRGEW
jgi:hypothetical protein